MLDRITVTEWYHSTPPYLCVVISTSPIWRVPRGTGFDPRARRVWRSVDVHGGKRDLSDRTLSLSDFCSVVRGRKACHMNERIKIFGKGVQSLQAGGAASRLKRRVLVSLEKQNGPLSRPSNAGL
jgi:hypothetical protein